MLSSAIGPKGVEVGVGQNFDVEIGASDGDQLQLDPFDHPGQSKPADGGAEELRFQFGGQGEATAVAALKPDRDDAGAKSARAVMVLAVNVVGHGAAERYEAGSRRRRQKPAVRHDELKRV